MKKFISWFKNLFTLEEPPIYKKKEPVFIYEEVNKIPESKINPLRKERAWKRDIWENRFKAD